MSLITPDFGLLFWMAVVFIVVLVILWKYGFPVIVKMINERKEYIDDSLRKAHEANEKLANIKLECESILQEANEQAGQIRKEAADAREKIISEAKETAKSESIRIIEEAKTEINNEKQNAIKGIRAQVAELSVIVAEKILREKLSSDSSQMALIDKIIDEMSVNNK